MHFVAVSRDIDVTMLIETGFLKESVKDMLKLCKCIASYRR